MTSFAFSSDRPLRVLLSVQNTEFKSHITELVGRAYYNIHNAELSTADSQWANAIVASALHICMDTRVQQKSTRELVHLFEDIIRVSEEHLREARRHASMATNAFYLRETVLDHVAASNEAPTRTYSTVVSLDQVNITRLKNRPQTDA